MACLTQFPRRCFLGWALLFGVWSSTAVVARAAEWTFEVAFTPEAQAEPYTGRVYVMFTAHARQEPRFGPRWFNTEPFFAVDVVNWKPGETLSISASTPGLSIYPRGGVADFPVDAQPGGKNEGRTAKNLKLAGMRCQAVVRFSDWSRELGSGEGNGYSDVVALGPEPRKISLNVARLVAERPFRESDSLKLLEVPSEKLRDFLKRRGIRNPEKRGVVRGSVRLPASYATEPERRYPVILEIPGFGGNHFSQPAAPVAPEPATGVEFIRVMLDPDCPYGHHVFADSATNGPVGTALVEDFLPALDARFRTVPEPRGRFLTGHSSGGWSSLWLQVAYPTSFGGVWSTAPDPVDFRDFQRINLYEPGTNMFVDAQGAPRPIARRGSQVLILYRDFSEMEDVYGDGGQLRSFEAVFSPLDADGRPRRVWDRSSGAVDLEAARAWEPYDIRLVLERRWDNLQPLLRGKLHIFMGEEDTFYLEGATRLLKSSLENLKSDAVVELVPGRDHGSLLDGALRARIAREMAEAFRTSKPAQPAP